MVLEVNLKRDYELESLQPLVLSGIFSNNIYGEGMDYIHTSNSKSSRVRMYNRVYNIHVGLQPID